MKHLHDIKRDPDASSGQHWCIAVGPHAARGLGGEGVIECVIHAWLAGPKRGTIEIEDPRRDAPLVLTAEQAEAVAKEHDHDSCRGEQRVEAALLDAAHLVRQALGQPSKRKRGRL